MEISNSSYNLLEAWQSLLTLWRKNSKERRHQTRWYLDKGTVLHNCFILCAQESLSERGEEWCQTGLDLSCGHYHCYYSYNQGSTTPSGEKVQHKICVTKEIKSSNKGPEEYKQCKYSTANSVKGVFLYELSSWRYILQEHSPKAWELEWRETCSGWNA